MDLLTTQGTKLAPKDTAEGVADFRAQVIGPLLTRAFTSHGELAHAIRALARQKHMLLLDGHPAFAPSRGPSA